VDIPSGLHADSGAIMGAAVAAEMTITFIGLKTGLFTGEAANVCGEILLDTLGLPETVFNGITPEVQRLTKTPLPARLRAAHKGNYGHVLLVGGNHGFSGAIRLAAEAALRAGAGLVSIASRAEHAFNLNIGRPELMCHGVETPEQFAELLQKATVVVIGPGLGQDEWAQMLFASVYASDKPCVVDADGLNLLASKGGNSPHWILTPHPGEAARLLACKTVDIAGDRYAAVKQLQTRYGGVSVLKGAGSLISYGSAVFVGSTGNPGMATAGMGDVLSGILGALLAQGLSLVDAAKLGVYVHGEAADHVADRQGERGMLASDLFPEILRCLN
jgi:NAD(P)H-hydrate epimerase